MYLQLPNTFDRFSTSRRREQLQAVKATRVSFALEVPSPPLVMKGTPLGEIRTIAHGDHQSGLIPFGTPSALNILTTSSYPRAPTQTPELSVHVTLGDISEPQVQPGFLSEIDPPPSLPLPAGVGGDEDKKVSSSDKDIFEKKCLNAATTCQKSSRCYGWYAIIIEVLAMCLANCCGFITNDYLWWGVAAGILGAGLYICSHVFKWKQFQEKYATLALNFLRLRKITSSDREAKFKEYETFMQSAILELDLL